MIRATLETLLVVAVCAAGAAATVPLLRRLGFETRLGSANRLAVAPLLVAGGANLAIAAVAFGVLRALRPDPAMPLGLGLDRRSAAVAVVAMAIAGAASLIDARLRDARTRIPDAPAAALLALGAALLCAAWMEEVVFRAGLLHTLAPAGAVAAVVVAVAAVVVSAAAFTAIHVPTARVHPHALARRGIGGVALAVVYLASGSVIVATAVHLARNLGNVLVYDASPVALTTWPARPTPRTRRLNAVAVSLLPMALALLVYR